MLKNLGIVLASALAGAYAQKQFGVVEKIFDFGKKCAASIKEGSEEVLDETTE